MTGRAQAGTLLTVKGLAKHFGGLKAVDGVDMEVRRGEIQALIGPNGSGKTTILNMLSGLYVPTAGEILLEGKTITGRKPHVITAHGMARTFQNIRLFGELTVLDNVLIGQHSRSRAGLLASIFRPASQQAEEAAMRRKALEALEFVGLRGKEFAEAKSLPYGQQRLLELARALVSDPKLLLLDEPAAGLNAAETEILVDLALPDPRPGHHHPAGRARHEPGDERVRPHHRSELRQEDRRRLRRSHREEPGGD